MKNASYAFHHLKEKATETEKKELYAALQMLADNIEELGKKIDAIRR